MPLIVICSSFCIVAMFYIITTWDHIQLYFNFCCSRSNSFTPIWNLLDRMLLLKLFSYIQTKEDNRRGQKWGPTMLWIFTRYSVLLFPLSVKCWWVKRAIVYRFRLPENLNLYKIFTFVPLYLYHTHTHARVHTHRYTPFRMLIFTSFIIIIIFNLSTINIYVHINTLTDIHIYF